MNATSLRTFFIFMLQQNVIHFYKGLYATLKLAQDLKLI